MKFTYANVMSTIAMFAAVTTGSSYAAAQLAANSVTTKQIRNGQVTTADLAPSVRKQLAGRAPVSGGGGTTTPTTGKPGAWANSGGVASGALAQCSSGCADTAGGYFGGPFVAATDISSKFGGAARANFRWTGSLTNNGSETAYVSLYVYKGATADLPAARGGYSCSTPYAGIAPGQTLTVADLGCNAKTGEGFQNQPTASSRYVRSRYDLISGDGTFPEGVSSTIQLEVQPLS